ncbi:MAG: glycosyltransferase [Selenomonadaceae bacterium]|nr:glycosyltransferase [Selenomonadaceae bacterium]MBR4382149.1 glycosyltransferase [Selenomonadaceae bacterium]
MELPAISVIIPLYNAEKYVGECLAGILAQTFQDFEVIVVNDCSTDSSVAVVEGYKKFFGERLKIVRTQKNSGGCAVPRNVGLPFSRGEYISFLDADDKITPTAFEELYSVAKKFDADVVACEKYYRVPEERWNDSEFRKTLKPLIAKRTPLVTEPTLLTNNFFERVESYCQPGNFLWNVWSKLIRRDFIFENNLIFANTIFEDVVFTSSVIFSTERFILVPNVVNYYRVVEGSASRTLEKGLAYFRKYVRALTVAFRHFDEFLSGKEFFRQHPDQKYLALNKVWNEGTSYLIEIYNQIPAYEFDEVAREEFSDGDNIALMAFAFNVANLRGTQFMQSLERVEELEKTLRQDKAYIAELEKLVTQLLSKG